MPQDLFSGKPLIYRRDGNGFIVYSVGEDGVDDGGTKTSIEEMKSDLGWIISR